MKEEVVARPIPDPPLRAHNHQDCRKGHLDPHQPLQGHRPTENGATSINDEAFPFSYLNFVINFALIRSLSQTKHFSSGKVVDTVNHR